MSIYYCFDLAVIESCEVSDSQRQSACKRLSYILKYSHPCSNPQREGTRRENRSKGTKILIHNKKDNKKNNEKTTKVDKSATCKDLQRRRKMI
ncbi:MAG: hypothetical protein IJ355_08295 [Prevotella sp.]|nr:hypothetical protein [Prevotella sp.]